MTEDLQPHGRVRHHFSLFLMWIISRHITFVLGVGLGLLIAHELGHLIFHLLVPSSQINEVIFFPFITRGWDNVIFAWGVSFVTKDVVIIDIGDFLFPFLFQSIYLIFLRKKVTSMEFILWGFISLLYLRSDFLCMWMSLRNGF